ncbi:MAG: ABC transporter substrate-binding protein [Gemmatimonadales bacterium]|jgi:peptide/nickel transport system substrate-binding protein
MVRDLVTGAAVVALLAGCGGGERAADSDAVPDTLRYGGTVVVASLNEINSMNHFASMDETSQEVQTYVLFTPLIHFDEKLAPAPYLAESWDTVTTRSGDLVLTFRLRDDVKWHDGVPTSAYDVKFTFERIKDPRTSYPHASLLAPYDSAVVADSFTVAFYLTRHPGFMDPWRRISPMPEHILGDVPPAELSHHPFGTESPLGNGPFRFVEHRSGDRWVFEANPDFAESLGGRPYLDRLVYRYIPEPTIRLAELLAGEVDVYLVVWPDQVAEIEARPEARVITYENRNYAFLNWNGRRTFFQNPTVRRALTLAIDRQRIVDVARLGLGRVAQGPVPPFHWAYNADMEPLQYDPERARALLDSAGWVDRDGDGVREKDVYKASFELKTNQGNPTREQILTLVQADLAKVGVEVNLRIQEGQSLRADITNAERRFDAFVLGWSADFNLDDRILFACSQLDGPYQWASYCNPRVDEILDQVAMMVDRSRALPLWHEYQEILQWEQPYTFLYYDVRANAVRARVRDVQTDIRGDFVNVTDWWIAPADRR